MKLLPLFSYQFFVFFNERLSKYEILGFNAMTFNQFNRVYFKLGGSVRIADMNMDG